MTALDPFMVVAYAFFGCVFAGIGLALASKNHPKIGGALMMSGGVSFLLMANYCYITALTPVTL